MKEKSFYKYVMFINKSEISEIQIFTLAFNSKLTDKMSLYAPSGKTMRKS